MISRRTLIRSSHILRTFRRATGGFTGYGRWFHSNIRCWQHPPTPKIFFKTNEWTKFSKGSVKFPYRLYSSLPDHIAVPLPVMSPTMESGTIIRWDKKEGDKLNEGDLLAEVETDKATMGFETPDEGYLAKIVIPAGTKDIPIGKVVCIIVGKKEDIAAFKDYQPEESKPSESPKQAETKQPKEEKQEPKKEASSHSPEPSSPAPPPEVHPFVQSVSVSSGQFVTPLAKSLAKDRGVDLSNIRGTGFLGAITSTDVGASSSTRGRQQKGPTYEDSPISGMRAIIAKRLLLSKQTVPHYYLTSEIGMDMVLTLRKQYNSVLVEKGDNKVSVNDFIVKAAAMACIDVPQANSSWQETFIRQFNTVDISIAVATERGLITPIVFEAEKKSIGEISKTIKELAVRAREGKLLPHEYQGGTFSITNLGMYGVHEFLAPVNPPQACTLAVGASTQKVIPWDNPKGHKPVHLLYVTLSCDHRNVDGAVGAKWLQQFKSFMTNPAAMML